MRDGQLLADESWTPAGLRNREIFALLPALLSRAGVQPAEIDSFALGRGPGAFTALRMASACLCGLALPGRKPVLGVPSCAATALELARQGCPAPISVVGDARRGRFWHARFLENGLPAEPDAMAELLDESALRDALSKSHTVASPDWERLEPTLRTVAPAGIRRIERNAAPRAETVALLADAYSRAGLNTAFTPIYLTPATAAVPRFA